MPSSSALTQLADGPGGVLPPGLAAPVRGRAGALQHRACDRLLARDQLIISVAYYEDPRYISLLLCSYPLSREKAGFDEPFLHVSGSIDAGARDDEVFQGPLRSCEE